MNLVTDTGFFDHLSAPLDDSNTTRDLNPDSEAHCMAESDHSPDLPDNGGPEVQLEVSQDFCVTLVDAYAFCVWCLVLRHLPIDFQMPRIRLLYLKRCPITMLCKRTCFNTWSSLSKSLIVTLITLLSNAWRRLAQRARTYILSRAHILISEYFTNFHLWPFALLNWY